MTWTRPWRRITVHFSQMGLTLARTFIEGSRSLVAVGDATSGEVVRGELHLDPIAGEDADVVHAHLPGDVREDLVAVLQLHAEHRVGEGLGHRALEHDRVFLGLGQRDAPGVAELDGPVHGGMHEARTTAEPGPGPRG